MQKYKSSITTTSGAAVRGVPVLVLDESGGTASLFLDRAGAVSAQNPLTTGADGTFYFYAVNGRYSLRTTVEGATITDDDVVLMMDPEEITVAGPIAEAVAAAEAAADRAELAVEDSGIPALVEAAQNAVVDASQAQTAATAAAALANTAKTEAAQAKADAEAAKAGSEAAHLLADIAAGSAEDSAIAAAASAASIDTAFLRDRANHTGTQAASSVLLSGTPLDQAIAPALALANTFTTVPTTNQGPMVVVTLPHLRFMAWDGAKYVRAPWHRPGRIFYTHHNNASEPGALPVRGDVSYDKANYPDFCEALGITGTGTFTLLEIRGEFLRVLDNGRGVDVGRVYGSAQGDAFKSHSHNTGESRSDADPTNPGASIGSHTNDTFFTNNGTGYTGSSGFILPTGGLETRPRNIALPAWVTY